MTFKPIGADHPSFTRVTRFARSLFEQGLADVRAGRLKCSPETTHLLETIENLADNFAGEASSAFLQEGASILAQVRAGHRR